MTLALPKIQVRAQGGESGGIGELNPVVGMTTIDDLVIQAIHADGTVVVSHNTNLGASGISLNPQDLIIYPDQASGVVIGGGVKGSWPSGVDVRQFDWRNKSFKTTSH